MWKLPQRLVPKTAEHLEEIGIITVSELVETDPGWIANELSNKRIKEANVEQWQYQAMLVCQVPNLRGHDSPDSGRVWDP